jgi:hypothetical protein
MATAGIEQYLYLLDEAFDGLDWHSLLGNLRSVDPEIGRGYQPAGRDPFMTSSGT